MKKPQARPLKLPSGSAKTKADNKAFWNEARSATESDFYTFGYEGRRTPEILDGLKAAGVRCVLDIRYNPVSMYRPELSKANLQSTLREEGIEYLHVREWGVPRDIRERAMASGSRETIWEWYDASVVRPFFERNLHRFLNMIDKLDTHFYVGNLHQYPNSWIIVGLFYPPPSRMNDLFG